LVDLKIALGERMISRGTEYCIRKGAIMYTCWRDSRTVLALSTAHPGHESEVKVTSD